MVDFYKIVKTSCKIGGVVTACAAGGAIGAFTMYYCHSSENTIRHFYKNTPFSNVFQRAYEYTIGSEPWAINEWIPPYEKCKIIGAAVTGCAIGIAIEQAVLGMISSSNSIDTNQDDTNDFFSWR